MALNVNRLKAPSKHISINLTSERPTIEGWLWKKGSLRKNWKKRWFKLNFNALAYFGNKESTMLLGIIPLEECILEEDADDVTGYRFSFIIFTTLGRDYSLRCCGENDIIEWLIKIKTSMANHKKNQIYNLKDTKKQRKLWINQLKKQFENNCNYLKVSPRNGITTKPNNDDNFILHSVFGVGLDEVLKIDGYEYKIPYVVRKCIEYIELYALKTEGIFRLSGDNEEIQRLKSELEKGTIIDLLSIKDHHTISSLLKLFIRELPEPLATYELYQAFLDSEKIKNKTEKVKAYQKTVSKLPVHNYNLLNELMRLLSVVNSYNQYNQMTAHNLAIVFAPNLFKKKDESIFDSLQKVPFVLSVTKTLIEEFYLIFEDSQEEEKKTGNVQNLFEITDNITEKELENMFQLAGLDFQTLRTNYKDLTMNDENVSSDNNNDDKNESKISLTEKYKNDYEEEVLLRKNINYEKYKNLHKISIDIKNISEYLNQNSHLFNKNNSSIPDEVKNFYSLINEFLYFFDSEFSDGVIGNFSEYLNEEETNSTMSESVDSIINDVDSYLAKYTTVHT